MGKVLPIALKLNFAPNTLGCYGLIYNSSDICILVFRNLRGGIGVVAIAFDFEGEGKGI